jgi:hypothetical protein
MALIGLINCGKPQRVVRIAESAAGWEKAQLPAIIDQLYHTMMPLSYRGA